MEKTELTSGPLAGITVVETALAAVGPWTGMLLGAMGADVIRVEHGRRDGMHHVAPLQNGMGTLYSHCNLNKRGIDLDLKDKRHLAAAYELIRHADVFIQNMSPGAIERLGLGYDVLSRINPRLIYATSTAWGAGGPMARMSGSDGPVQAFSGWASLNGAPGGKWEMYRYWGQVDINSSMYFLLGILQGLLLRRQTGKGLLVESSMLGGAIHAQISRLAELLATGKSAVPMGSASATTAPHQAFLCQDRRYVAVGVVREEQWPALCRALGAEDLLADPRFSTNAGRVTHRQHLVPRLGAIFQGKPSRWWDIRLGQSGVPYSHFLSVVDVLNHTQYRDNDTLVEIDVPHQGKMHIGNLPWRFGETPAGYRPPPLPGQHTQEVLRERGIDAATMELPRTPSPPVPAAGEGRGEGPSPSSAGILHGIRVIELAEGLCGPFAASMLADMGAEVIKVEPPEGDSARGYGPPFYEGGLSAVFAAVNRNKKSVVLDLKTAEGSRDLLALLATADVFIEDSGPGVAENAGYGYESLKQTNPRLVYCGITPFGSRGPWAGRPGCELAVQAMATACGTLGSMDGPPERVGVDVAAMSTAAAAAQGVLAALYWRGASGRGQRVDVDMLTTLVHMRGFIWISHSNPDSWEGWHCEAYTRPPDFGWMTRDRPVYFLLGRGTQENYETLLNTLGMEERITDPRFQGGGRQVSGHAHYAHEVTPVWEDGFKDLTAEEVCSLINRHGGEAVPFSSQESLLAHPQMAVLDMVRTVEHPHAGKIQVIVPPWHIGGVKVDAGAPPPLLGQHTAEILQAVTRGNRD